MNTALTVLAAMLGVLALYLPTRSQSFTRVTVDGRSIRMLIAGAGDATVVFENGLGGPLEHWGKVQPDVSRFARTVSYDRAGVGLSDKGPLPRDGRRIAEELQRALRAANIPPPYILVAHSLGGPFVRIYADRYPDDVTGMVLVDPTPDSEQVDGRATLPEHRSMPATLAQSRATRIRAGIHVFLIDAVPLPEVPFATDALRAVRMRNRRELAAESVEYREWLDTIPGSRLVVTNGGHNLPQEQPALVVATIRQAVDAAKGRAR